VTLLRRIAAFLYDFLVDDRWELFLGPIAALILVAVVVGTGAAGALAGALLVALVAGIAALSVALAVR